MLNYCHVLGLWKAPQIRLVRLLVHEVVRNALELVRVKIQNGDGIGSGFEKDCLEVIHHDKTVDRFFKVMNEPFLTVFIHVHNAVFLISFAAEEHKTFVDGFVEVQYFFVIVFQFDVCCALNDHFLVRKFNLMMIKKVKWKIEESLFGQFYMLDWLISC
jgi:hypothetical protein